ncbi:phage tail tape measure protein [Sphingobacterium sp. UT-1RO-CII-1]|uniref:phage tail tape measure protein n=1 Tax=Sphingobacterium sp. UT-1RO-CII-1 TaxID=2995225 RepID=UPI00227D26F3|nr:phage tail tape measure protein [Sphingobacterium sp. UT-1RO-CII-1]MCY4781454.1 phage tail tape measure protein [Sphingobacterium sp. UT-1RO-CII-1]
MAEVKFKFIGDDSDLRKRLANLARLQAEMTEKFNVNLNKSVSNGIAKSMRDTAKEAVNAAREVDILNKTASDKAITAAKLDQMEAFKQARLAIEAERRESQRLKNEYDAGRISLQKFKEEQYKLNAERKEQARIERELKKYLAENSEYGKLAKALNTVRKEAKEVLAEMFRLERAGYKNSVGYAALEQKSKDLVKQTNILDTGIKKIDASLGQHQRNVGNYSDALELISPQISQINQRLAIFGTSLDQLSSKSGGIKELGSAFLSVGKNIVSFALSPIGLLVTALVGLFMLFKNNRQTVANFNSGLRDISKTTDIVGKDLRSLGGSIVDLSMKLKVVDATKLTEYAAIAGQLGVKGRADILAFTEALAMLETASDIRGEDGGKEIARMLTLVDGGVQNVKAFGDEIVNLGNNFAASEKEILGNAEAISQNVGLYRIGRQEVLGYATATKSLGIEAEVVGSTFQKTLGLFEKSIRSGKGVADILKVVGGSAADLQARFKTDASGVFQDYIKGLNDIHKAGGSVQAQMERNGIMDIRQRRVIGTLAAGYDTLSRAMDTVKNANGAMQEEFENGAGKLVEQSKRMGIAWDNFVLSIEDGEGVIGRSVVAIIGFFADLLDQINKTFNPTSSQEFWTRMNPFGNQTADKIREINKAMTEAESVVKRVSDFDFNNSSQHELNDVFSETTSIIENLSETYKRYKKDVNEGVLTDAGKNNLKDFEDTLNFLRIKQANFLRFGAKAVGGNTITNVKTEEDEELDEKAKRAAERAAEQARQAVERQRALQLSIDQINEQVTRSNLSRDEQELVSVKDKYKKIREEVRKFYADPKNKGLRVDEGGLSASEKFETSEAERRILNKAILADIEEKRSLYAQFEQYKLELGLAKAEELMRGQLDITKSYLQVIEEEFGKSIVVDPTEMTAAQRELYEAVAKLDLEAKQDAKKKEERQYADILKLMETYADKRLRLISDFEEKRNKIVDSATAEQLKAFDEKHVEELNALDDANIQKLQVYKNLFEGIEKLSDASSRKVIADAKARLLSEKDMSPELRKQIIEALRSAEESLDNRLYDRTSKVAEEFSRMAGYINNVNQELGDMLSLVSNVLKASVDVGTGFKELTKNLNNYQKNKTDGGGGILGEISAIAGVAGSAGKIVSAVTSVVSGVLTIGKRTKEMNRQARAEVQKFYDEAIRGEMEYQALLRQREIDTVARGKSSYNAIIAQLDALKKQSPEIEKSYNKIFSALQSEEYIDDKGYKHGTWFRKAKTWDIMASLQGADYDRLEKLYSEGRLKDKAKADFEALRALRDELEKLGLSLEDLQADMNRLLTGTDAAALASGLHDLLENGVTNAALNAGKSFQDIMRNAIKATFQAKYLQDAMTPFYNELAAMMEAGTPTEKQIDALREKYESIAEKAAKEWENIEKITGQDLSDKTSKQGELAKGIAGITESAPGRIEAEFGGLRLAQLELLQVSKINHADYLRISSDKLGQLIAIQNNTFRTANNTDRLENIETAIVQLNNKITNTDAIRRGAGF